MRSRQAWGQGVPMTGSEPGWGTRHPDVRELLDQLQPMAVQEEVWANGTLPLRISAYAGRADLPDDLLLSVRCFVLVGDAFVLCTNADGSSHPWPGGRREPGESLLETARREVHEETGWHVDPTSLKQLGWLHFERLVDEADPRYPHPDFLQVVFVGRAASRDESQGGAWTDTEGYEIDSRLVSLTQAGDVIDDAVSRAFVLLIEGA